MTSVNENVEPSFVLLMEMAWRAFRSTLEREFRPRVNRELGPHASDLRTSHLRLLSLTPDEGMRVTDLAVRATMTKQALGEFVATLQRAGLVEVATGDRDRRVRVVRPTAEGRHLRQVLQAALDDIERRWRAQVGPQRWVAFREVLAEVGSFGLDRDGTATG